MNSPLARLARSQWGVWSLRQALSCGYTVSQVKVLLRAGKWQRVRHGIYCSGEQEIGQIHRGAATALAAPRRVILSHGTAAAFFGFHLTRDAAVHVTIDSRRWHSVSRSGVIGHRSSLFPDDVVQRGHVRATSPLRTVIDLACSLPGHEGLAAADRALRLGAIEKASLLAYAEEHLRGRTGRRAAQTIAAWADGRSESAPESHLRWRYIDSSLPVPSPQTTVPIDGVEYRTDLGYRFARLGSEYDSDERHAGGRQRRSDRDRDDAFRRHGWLLLYVTPAELYRSPQAHVQRVDHERRVRGFDPVGLRRRQTPGRYGEDSGSSP